MPRFTIVPKYGYVEFVVVYLQFIRTSDTTVNMRV